MATNEKIRIYDLARELGLETKAMLRVLDDMGVEYKSHSSTLEVDIAEDIRQLVEEERREREAKEAQEAEEARRAAMPRRAPVVTVMGHVDHGKTSLLDYIRKAKVAAREAGGITQHIGAYRVKTSNGEIAFLDTPGHEAFTSIRQRGANVTDIAIIVIAADDSIMPQTREAIAHAKAADVQLIVAINKIDLPGANPDKVLQDLVQMNMVPSEYGGDIETVRISAKTGDGVDELLEHIALTAELMDFRADPEAEMEGTVIESILDKRAGVLATVLIQQGTLRVADYIVSGESWAKVRNMFDEHGKPVKEAGPSTPVQILGFSDQPLAGDTVEQVGSEQSAKGLVASRMEEREDAESEANADKKITLADLFGKKETSKVNVILRADTQGSLEAIKGVIAQEAEVSDEVEIDIMLDAVGAPTESDLLLASTADAHVMSFGVNPTGAVKREAERQNIPLKSYRIIYELIEDVRRLVRGQIEPEYEEKVLGHAEVRMVISVPKSGNIAGSYVTDGIITRNAKARLMRNGKEIYKGAIATLKRFKDDVREVKTGFECGINLQNYDSYEEGDVIEAYHMVEIPLI